MAVRHGYDPERDDWSRDATERLLWDIVQAEFQARELTFQWQTDMDLGYGVDALMRTPARNYSLAIRIRGREYRHMQDVTWRYDSLQQLGKRLEVDKSVATHMFYGYADTNRPTPATCLIEWHLLRNQMAMELWRDGILKPETAPTCNRDGSSRLIAFGLSQLRQHNLIVASWVSPSVVVLLTPHRKPAVPDQHVLEVEMKARPALPRLPGF